MQTFITVLISSFKMLVRNRVLILTSLGLALISIFVFGWLFGNGGNYTLHLGIVDQDNSAISSSIVTQLHSAKALATTTGTESSELAALRAGKLDAVLIMGPNFGTALSQSNAQLRVYYDQSNITTLSSTRGAVGQIVEGVNANLSGRPPALTISEQAVSVHNLRQIDFVTPGMMGMMLLWANLAVGTVLVTWRQQGIMKRLAATPLRPATLIGAQMVARLALSLLQAAVLIGIAMAVFNVQVTGSWLALIVTLVVGTLAMMAIGFVVGSFAKNSEVAQGLFFMVSFPMMFLSGSYFSIANAPAFLAPVINVIPLTHLNNALREIINNGGTFVNVQTDLLILTAWIVAGFLFATRAFRWS